MSEPDAGSAVTDLKTSAKPDGKDYIVNGTKVFSTFSPRPWFFSYTCATGRVSAASAPFWSSAARRASRSVRRRSS